MSERTTIASLSRKITSDAEAYAYLEGLIWGDTPACGHCDSTDVYLIRPSNGVSRKTRTGAHSERRVWKCRTCTRQFSVITNTVFHGTKVSIRSLVLIAFEMCASKNGTSAREIERKYGMCPRTAWFVLHRLRAAMSNGDTLMYVMGANVVADETYIGGDPKNRHASDPRGKTTGRGTDKVPVFSIIDAETGEVRSRVVPNVTGATLGKIIAENTDMGVTTLHTDSYPSYKHVSARMAAHHVVNHKEGQYVTEKSKGTNVVEGYFSQLKRSLDGTHHRVSREHLHRYVGEFDFRYTTCHDSDTTRMGKMFQQSGRRLTYKVVKSLR